MAAKAGSLNDLKLHNPRKNGTIDAIQPVNSNPTIPASYFSQGTNKKNRPPKRAGS